MIEILNQLDKEINKGDVPSEVWVEWEESRATRHFKQYIKQEIINTLDELTRDTDKPQYHRGVIHTLDQLLNYKPENVND